MEIFQDDKVFTLIWKIRNVSFGWKDGAMTVKSPIFNFQTTTTSSWRLGIVQPISETDWIHHCLCAMNSVSSLVGYEIACLDQNGSCLISIQVPRADFSTKLQHNGAFMRNEGFLSQDTLIIRLKMWEVDGSRVMIKQVFAETELEVRTGSSLWFVKKFSNLKYGETRAMLLRNSSTESMSISFDICQEDSECITIKAKLSSKLVNWDNSLRRYKSLFTIKSKPVKHFKGKFFLLDDVGCKVECGKLDIIASDKETKHEWEFPLTMKKTYLLQNKTRFLQNDVLSLQCDFAFATGHISEKIIDSKVDDDFNFSEKNSEKLNTLREDLKSLYADPIIFDTKLKTATETFPAHCAILSARSPVFRAMFTTDMREKTKECVDIEDLDGSTVRRMLLFLYSDILQDLDWESAKNLYIASDKYDIRLLRHLCANYLKKNLLPSNCCDVLLLAHMHQDSKLESSVQDFMSVHTKEILISEGWKILEKNHTSLTSETIRLLLLKNLPK